MKKLSGEDKEWLSGEIAQQLEARIDEFRPHGWRKLVKALREIGPIAASISIVLILVGMVITLGIFATNRVTQEAEFRGKTDSRLTAVEGRLKDIDTHLKQIDANLLSLQTSFAANKPTEKTSIVEAKDALATAQRNSIQLPPDIVAQSGKKFIDAASQTPTAWDAALRFLDYRSFLNEPYSPDLKTKFTPVPGSQITAAFYVKGEGPITVNLSWPNELVPIAQAAIYQPISGLPQPPPIAVLSQTEGHPFVLVQTVGETGKIILDGMHLKNVILRGVHIKFDGQPLILENVYFVNCTFEFADNPKTRTLATAILTLAPAITFTV